MKSKKKIEEEFKGIGYRAFVFDDKIQLYNPNETTKYSNLPYVATVTAKGNSYVFNNKKYSDLLELKNAVAEYNTKLEYAPETYDPFLTEEARTNMRIDTYLEQLEFKSKYAYKGSCYEITDMYGLSIIKLNVFFDDDNDIKNECNGTILIHLKNSAWIESRFKNIEEAITAINSIVKTNLFVIAAKCHNAIEKSIRTLNLDNVQMVDASNLFNIKTKSMKEDLIAELEKTLKELKEQ